MGQIQAVCISKRKGTVKHSASRGRLLPAHGLEGDALNGTWHRQISLLPREGVFCRVLRGGEVKPGTSLEHVPSCASADPL